jgi:hypothetical protein
MGFCGSGNEPPCSVTTRRAEFGIREDPGSNLVLEIACTDRDFLQFNPGKFRASASN